MYLEVFVVFRKKKREIFFAFVYGKEFITFLF